MPDKIPFKPLSLEQLDVESPEGLRETLSLLQNRMMRAFAKVEELVEGGDGITVEVNGTRSTLNEALMRGICPVGTILIMYISWGTAVQMAANGWYPADGDNGTTPWIPRRNSGHPQRYVKSVAWGTDPWSGTNRDPKTGGAAWGSIALSIDAHGTTQVEPCGGGAAVTVLTDTNNHCWDLDGGANYDPPHIEAIPMMRVR